MSDRDPLEKLLSRPDPVVAPSPDFARRLRERVLAELASDETSRNEVPTMQRTDLIPMSPPTALRRRRARGRGPAWLPAFEVAAAILLMLGVAGYFAGGHFRPRSHGIASLTATPAAATQAAMLGGNAARTGEQPGPGPTGMPGVLWRAGGGDTGADRGASRSAPVAVDGRVYQVVAARRIIGSPVPRGDVTDTFVRAVDITDGRELWRTRLNIFGSPAATAGMVFADVIERNGNAPSTAALVALDAATGDEAWRVPIGDPTGWVAQSPVVAGGVVYTASPDGTAYAIDARTGKPRWVSTAARSMASRQESTSGQPAISGSGPFAVGNAAVYVVNASGELFALDAATGAAKWDVSLPARYQMAFEGVDPIAVDGAVLIQARGFVGTGAQSKSLDFVATLAAETGQSLWRHDFSGSAGRVAVSHGLVIVPIINDKAPKLIALDLQSAEQRWAFAGLGGAAQPPSIAGDVAYLPSQDGNLSALDVATGRERWHVSTGGPLAASPAVAGGIAIVADYDGNLTAYGAGGATPPA